MKIAALLGKWGDDRGRREFFSPRDFKPHDFINAGATHFTALDDKHCQHELGVLLRDGTLSTDATGAWIWESNQ